MSAMTPVHSWTTTILPAVVQTVDILQKTPATRMGFEPTRAEHNGLAVHRLNHSATSSCKQCFRVPQYQWPYGGIWPHRQTSLLPLRSWQSVYFIRIEMRPNSSSDCLAACGHQSGCNAVRFSANVAAICRKTFGCIPSLRATARAPSMDSRNFLNCSLKERLNALRL